MFLDDKRVLITGGTGSLGHRVVHRILGGALGKPQRVTVFSRDEAKQHFMRLRYLHRDALTDEIIYENSTQLLRFRIGDVRDYSAVLQALREADVVIHAAALKQVPTCEYFPAEAIATNITGAHNLVRAIRENETPVEAVVGLSTDKACKPINVMGMTKALMERIFVEANIDCPGTRFVCVRYGNVIASRGSVVPLFLSQIARGGPVTVTMKEMTRFLLSLDRAVETVLDALRHAARGEIYVPTVPAARVVELADALIADRPIEIVYTGIRPGEKIHEIMVSEEECYRTVRTGDYYAIRPTLPELHERALGEPAMTREYSSADITVGRDGLRELVAPYVSEAAHDAVTLA